MSALVQRGDYVGEVESPMQYGKMYSSNQLTVVIVHTKSPCVYPEEITADYSINTGILLGHKVTYFSA